MLENPSFKGGFTKNQYRGGRLPKKGGLGLFIDLRGGLGKKEEGGVFEGGVETPMHTMFSSVNLLKLNSFTAALKIRAGQ